MNPHLPLRRVPVERGLMLAAVFFCLLASDALAAAPPKITSFSPKKGPVGSTVVIKGTDFESLISVTFAGNAAAAGRFTTTQITVTVPEGAENGPIEVKTQNGQAFTPTAFTLGAAGPPEVTLEATIPSVVAETGKDAEITVDLSDVQSKPTTVHYMIKGTAINGTDFMLLTDTVKIPVGKMSKVIKIAPKGDLGGVSAKTVKLILIPDAGYQLGTPDSAKVRILAK